jgi:hypothetical protein
LPYYQAVTSQLTLSRACRRVAEICSSLKNAEEEISERSTRLLSNCMQLEMQLEILGKVREHFDERSEFIQTRVLYILTVKLKAADSQLHNFVGSRPPGFSSGILPTGLTLSKWKRSKYAMAKDNLDKAINDIESWQQVSLNPLWFTIMKAQSQEFDRNLNHAIEKNTTQTKRMIADAMAVRNPLRKASSSRVFLPPGRLKSAVTTEIGFSSVKAVQIDGKWRLVDTVSYLSREAVRELVVKLQSTNPTTFGLLTCLGAVQNENDHDNFSLIFRWPEGMNSPETLRTSMAASNRPHSLTERFRLALQLALGVYSIHAFDMVHKSIRPENIILFQDQKSALGSAFLLGFERLRKDEDETRLTEDSDWKRNLYRHPQRQGSNIQDRYVMQHDIYSLGVCMLEIGLWSSFIEGSILSDVLAGSQDTVINVGDFSRVSRSEMIKKRLVNLAKGKLAETMGTKYSEVVESCLTCLDLGNENFDDESENGAESIVIAIRYIEKVSCIHRLV